MFALLFDRKSGFMTLLAVSAVGALLFAAGLVMGVSMSWEKLASHLPRATPPAPAAAPAASPPTGIAPGAAAVTARARPRTLAETAEPAAFSRREPAAPPADWVPLTDGAPWPGAVGEAGDGKDGDRGDTAEAPETPAAGTLYYVQAGTFSDEAGAEEMRTSLRPLCRGKHWQPFVESVWDRYGRRIVAVRIGPFASEAAAQELSAGLNGSLVRRTSGRRT